MPDSKPTTTPRRARAALIAAAAIAAAAAATATLVLTTGSSPARPPTAAQAARQRAIATGRALNAGGGSAEVARRPQLRLGILATPADATGLAAARLGYIAARLSPSGTQLTTTAYTTPSAETAALADGTLDAAYITPAAAIAAWQHTGHAIRIIAGADQTTTGTPAIVLAIRAAYLTSHPSQTTDLLQGHIQATMLLTTSPALGLPAARTELVALSHHQISKAAATAFSRYRSTNDAGRPDITATEGAATGELFDLATVDTLLRASGLALAS